jgi:hypothetical protein
VADSFLYCETLRKEPYEAGELRNTNDVLVSNVTDIGLAIKGKGMVFTKCKKRDGPFYDLA